MEKIVQEKKNCKISASKNNKTTSSKKKLSTNSSKNHDHRISSDAQLSQSSTEPESITKTETQFILEHKHDQQSLTDHQSQQSHQFQHHQQVQLTPSTSSQSKSLHRNEKKRLKKKNKTKSNVTETSDNTIDYVNSTSSSSIANHKDELEQRLCSNPSENGKFYNGNVISDDDDDDDRIDNNHCNTDVDDEKISNYNVKQTKTDLLNNLNYFNNENEAYFISANKCSLEKNPEGTQCINEEQLKNITSNVDSSIWNNHSNTSNNLSDQLIANETVENVSSTPITSTTAEEKKIRKVPTNKEEFLQNFFEDLHSYEPPKETKESEVLKEMISNLDKFEKVCAELASFTASPAYFEMKRKFDEMNLQFSSTSSSASLSSSSSSSAESTPPAPASISESASSSVSLKKSVLPQNLENINSTLNENINITYKEYENELQMPDIMRLIQKDLSEPYSIYTYRYFIHNWPKLCFLAMHNDLCVGAIVCKLDIHRQTIKRGYIAMLAVDQDYRKLKIGTNLVQKAIQVMLNESADEVVLETEITNIPALRLYENLGFVRDKRLFDYYLNGVDALRLKLWFR